MHSMKGFPPLTASGQQCLTLDWSAAELIPYDYQCGM